MKRFDRRFTLVNYFELNYGTDRSNKMMGVGVDSDTDHINKMQCFNLKALIGEPKGQKSNTLRPAHAKK